MNTNTSQKNYHFNELIRLNQSLSTHLESSVLGVNAGLIDLPAFLRSYEEASILGERELLSSLDEISFDAYSDEFTADWYVDLRKDLHRYIPLLSISSRPFYQELRQFNFKSNVVLCQQAWGNITDLLFNFQKEYGIDDESVTDLFVLSAMIIYMFATDEVGKTLFPGKGMLEMQRGIRRRQKTLSDSPNKLNTNLPIDNLLSLKLSDNYVRVLKSTVHQKKNTPYARNVVFNELLFQRFRCALSQSDLDIDLENIYSIFYDLYVLTNPVFELPKSINEYALKDRGADYFSTFKQNTIRDIVESKVSLLKDITFWEC